ncbi:protoporphyrin IX magnesium-chelatase [Saccharopolyspora kobensis]|uniref:Mg-protoporphyrin IX chelatase n=1 Tax=Saccharopolyspora kobensis TaxID=146035 RepID=A0A1H6BTI7_9PSEU|nr:putative cobaltochelatase [Saccharopolyspora kobensis]SEG64041.1 protoporphyrin IX magnesium-chelatase [Saccharopolyspora kobensis]SFC15672.1 protoporphyrin IX magnesium-chelatase [Saccharopolyspora kobensis]
MTAAPRFPFSAVVGHDDLRLALLLNAVHPRIGGVLVRGEKGTAKSTVVRALASLLPPLDVISDCRFGCAPTSPDPQCPDGPHGSTAAQRPAQLVELPVGATEDRLIGSLDLERALTEGVRAFQPGLLAAAHRGVLYVDEVNLLHDHLVDLLLDAAAMGRAHVEREGVSVSHAASFLLVGTMNPEEGELRPQLLDRFGLTVHVAASREVATRTEVVRRRLAFEADPAGFAAKWAEADAELAESIRIARDRVPRVQLPDAELRRISALCASFDVDGMRADLVLARTAIAHAAWRGADAVVAEDVEAAARLALPHRRRRDPFDEPGMAEDQLEQALAEAAEHAEDGPEPPDGPDGPDGGGQAPEEPAEPSGGSGAEERSDGRAPADKAPAAPTPAFRARLLEVPGLGDGAPGRRSRSRSRSGRTTRPSTVEGHGVHVAATLAAAAPHQVARGRSGPGLVLRSEDLRRGIREGREGNLVLFAVDASGSMAARERMSAVSGAVLSLLRDAYQRRDKVGVVTFRGDSAELALPPTSSVDIAAARMRGLRTGGRTPLADGLLQVQRVVQRERTRDPQRRALVVLLTDGKATVAVDSGLSGRDRAQRAVADALRAAGLVAGTGAASIVVDCESGMVRLGLPAKLAAALGGPCLRLEELSAENVAGVVRAVRDERPQAA